MEGLVRAERVEHMSIFVCLSVKLASMMRKLASMMISGMYMHKTSFLKLKVHGHILLQGAKWMHLQVYIVGKSAPPS